MERGYEEGIFLKNGEESPLHCLVMEMKNAGVCAPAHYHKYIEILYGIDCDITVWAGDKFEKFTSGDICYIGSGETHFLCSEREENKYYVIKFFPEILNYEKQLFSEMRYLFPIMYNATDFPRIISGKEPAMHNVGDIIKNIFSEWKDEATGYEFAIRGQILRVFSALLRSWKPQEVGGGVKDDNFVLVNKSIGYINENFDTVSEENLAKLLCVSYSHLSRTFKKITGKSFASFVAEKRIAEAKRLLLTTAYSITEIAQRTGFSSSSHFIAKFREQTGETPLRYRSKLNEICR